MKRWTHGLLVVMLAGCSGKDEDCGPRRKAAAEAVVAASPELERARADAQRAVDDARASRAALTDAEKDLATRIELFEQSMDCLVHHDCCKRIHAFDNAGKTQIWSALGDVFRTTGVPMPAQVDAVLAPMKPLDLEAEDLIGATPQQAQKFCTDARQHLARIRQQAPAAWKAAGAAIDVDLAARKAQLELAQRRVTAIGQWADALRKNAPATIAADVSGGGDGYGHARELVARYNTTCH